MALLALVVLSAFGLLVLVAPTASAHVVPMSTIQLDLHDSTVDADVSIPVSDVAAATQIGLGDGSQAEVDANADAIGAYLLGHFTPTSDDGRAWSVSIGDLVVSTAGARGLLSMVSLGMRHIQEGIDHQLFLLTLLLPAPLLARGRRWSGSVPARRAVRRIATITCAFTVGHSVTLALGALGVPAPQVVVEALIAVSILVAAGHAIRPVFPGREAVVAAAFGLVHGLAFSAALRELDLTGTRLVLSLLGFNLGIEIMQLIVVALVLPPLTLLAGAGRYQGLRVVAAGATAVAAAGWLAARVGYGNPAAAAADRVGLVASPVVVTLWLVALLVARAHRRRRSAPPRAAATTDVPVSLR